MKSKGFFGFAVALLLTLVSPAVLAQRAALRLDCASKTPLPPEMLILTIQDDTSKGDKAHLESLLRPACRTAMGAFVASGGNAKWIRDQLRFVLVDKVQGSPANAAYVGFKRIDIAPGILNGDEDLVLFALAHELGHAVFGHYGKGTIVGLATKTAGAVAGLGALANVASVRPKTAVVLGAASLGLFAKGGCITGAFQTKWEFDADRFGVLALSNAGMSLDDAKALAIRVMESHAEPPTTCETPNVKSNPHPSTHQRIEAIRKI